MTERPPQYKLGDLVNGYVLTANGWIPVQQRPAPLQQGPTQRHRAGPVQQDRLNYQTGTPQPPRAPGPPKRSSGLPTWAWVLVAIVGVPIVFGFVARLGSNTEAELSLDEPQVQEPQVDEPSTAEREVACVRWNAEWGDAVAQDNKSDPASLYFPLMASQPADCEVASQQFVYDLWHGTWESAEAVKGWPKCTDSLVTGAPVTDQHRSVGCADGYIEVSPEVTECTDGTALVAIDDTGLFRAGLSGYGLVGQDFTGIGDKPFSADAGYADALEACTT